MRLQSSSHIADSRQANGPWTQVPPMREKQGIIYCKERTEIEDWHFRGYIILTKFVTKMEEKYEPIQEKMEQVEEGSMEDIKIVEIIENSRTRAETLKEKLAKANGKVYNWMAGIAQNEIGQTIEDWDKLSLLKMVEMADHEIQEHPQKLNLWLPWLECAIPKCSQQIDGFNARFKNLIKLAFD